MLILTEELLPLLLSLNGISPKISHNHTIQNCPDIMRIILSITCRFFIIKADKESDIAGSKKEVFYDRYRISEQRYHCKIFWGKS